MQTYIFFRGKVYAIPFQNPFESYRNMPSIAARVQGYSYFGSLSWTPGISTYAPFMLLTLSFPEKLLLLFIFLLSNNVIYFIQSK